MAKKTAPTTPATPAAKNAPKGKGKAAPAAKPAPAAAPATAPAADAKAQKAAAKAAAREKHRYWVPIVVCMISKPAPSLEAAMIETRDWTFDQLLNRLSKDSSSVLADQVVKAAEFTFTIEGDDGNDYRREDWDFDADKPKADATPLPKSNERRRPTAGEMVNAATESAAATLEACNPKKPVKSGKGVKADTAAAKSDAPIKVKRNKQGRPMIAE
jgi:hypothetical protein